MSKIQKSTSSTFVRLFSGLLGVLVSYGLLVGGFTLHQYLSSTPRSQASSPPDGGFVKVADLIGQHNDDLTINKVLRALDVDSDLYSRLQTHYAKSLVLQENLKEFNETDLLELLDKQFGREFTREAIRQVASTNPQSALSFVLKSRDSNREHLIKVVFLEAGGQRIATLTSQLEQLTKNERIIALQSVLQSVDSADHETIEFVKQQFGLPELIDEGYKFAVIERSRNDPIQTLKELVEHGLIYDKSNEKTSNSNHELVKYLLRDWIDRDGFEVLEHLKEHFDGVAGKTLFHLALQRLSFVNPDRCIEFVLKQSQEFQNMHLPVVFKSWAQLDALQAFQTVNELKNQSSSDLPIEFVLETWARNNPIEFLEHFDLHLSELTDELQELALLALSNENPKEAVHHLHSSQAEISLDVRRQLLNNWAADDLRNAVHWVREHSGEHRRFLLSSVLTTNVARHARRAVDFARQEPIEDGAIGLEVEVIAELARYRLGSAMELLSRVRGGKTKIYAHAEVAMEVIRSLDSFNIGLTIIPRKLNKEEQNQFFEVLVQKWISHDPYELYAQINHLPLNIKAEYAANLLSENLAALYLTKTEISKLESVVDEFTDSGLEPVTLE